MMAHFFLLIFYESVDFNFSCLFFADSGIQSVGDSIRGSSDSMSNGGPSHSHESSTNASASTASTTLASASKNSKTKQENLHAKTVTPEQHFESLVQKVFGGKMQTTYECSNCKSVSLHKECFTDLHLAFPEKTKNDLTMQVKVFSYACLSLFCIVVENCRRHKNGPKNLDS